MHFFYGFRRGYVIIDLKIIDEPDCEGIPVFKRCLPLLCALLLLAGCGARESEESQQYTTTLLAMDTVMDITICGGSQELMNQARERVLKLEGLLSATDPGSEVYALNQTGTAELSEDTAALLARGLELCRETEGALDLSVYPVVRAWGFTTGAYRVPQAGELASKPPRSATPILSPLKTARCPSPPTRR